MPERGSIGTFFREFPDSKINYWLQVFFFDKEINLRAGALTFFTLSGIVPICVSFICKPGSVPLRASGAYPGEGSATGQACQNQVQDDGDRMTSFGSIVKEFVQPEKYLSRRHQVEVVLRQVLD